jgi:hypothetical protein
MGAGFAPGMAPLESRPWTDGQAIARRASYRSGAILIAGGRRQVLLDGEPIDALERAAAA